MKKAPVLLHPEQESAQKHPWERMEGEPAHYFLLFRTYAQMGRERSLQAIAEQEKQSKKAIKGPKNESVQAPEETQTEENAVVEKVSISGALKRGAKQWKWRERAAAYDETLRLDRHKELLSYLDHEAEYITKAQRLDALDMLMRNLMRITLGMEEHAIMDDRAYNRWLAMHRQMLATLRGIRREMKELDASIGLSVRS